MRFPSKVTPFRASVLSKFPPLLKQIKNNDISVMDLFINMHGRIDNPTDFLEALDCLFALNKIELTKQEEKLHYVD
jgi:hypothetical protein